MPRCRNWYVDASKQRQALAESVFELGTSSGGPHLASLAKMTLIDFRLPGRRTWKPDGDFGLHVIHGLNGTGKSTIVDAIELLLTNDVERVTRGQAAGSVNYDSILSNHDSAGIKRKAEMLIELKAPDKMKTLRESLKFEVGESGMMPSQGASQKVKAKSLFHQLQLFKEKETWPAGCFRLEQNMSDRLTLGTTADRARTILFSFFPDSNQHRTKLEAFNLRWKEAMSRLTEVWPMAEAVSWLRPILDGDNKRPAIELVSDQTGRYSSSSVELKDIIRLYSENVEEFSATLQELVGEPWIELQRAVDSLGRLELENNAEILTRVSKDIDAILSRLADSIGRLKSFRQRLDEVFHWKAEGRAQAGSFKDYHQLVSNWLNEHVQYDLIRRIDEVSSTITETPDLASEFERQLSPLKSMVEGTRKRTSAWVDAKAYQQKRDSSWNKILRFETYEQSTRPSTPPPRVSSSELAEMDRWIPMQPPFSQLVQTAIERNEPQSGIYRDSTIIVGTGEPSAGASLVKRIDSLCTTSERLRELKCRTVRDLNGTLVALASINELCLDRETLDDKVMEELESQFKSNSNLGMALNELMSLFTPARWAYQDVGVEAKLQGEEPGVAFTSRERPISQVLNTAELNTLGLSLFLLCAPRIPTPINLLVLDDPLQNMDELTVTTVARGIDRLLLLWQSDGDREPLLAPLSDLKVLLLLHGEDDVDRFRTETPCYIYTLPWLIPESNSSSGSQKAEQLIGGSQSMPNGISKPKLKLVARVARN